MKKAFAILLAVSMIALFGYACDDGSSSGGIVVENVSSLSGTEHQMFEIIRRYP